MEFSFEGICRLTLAHSKGSPTSKHVKTDFFLEVSENLDKSQYINDEDILTKDGSHALSQCFIQGLVGIIHFAHQQGFRDSAEHLRYIITELERGFASVATAEKRVY